MRCGVILKLASSALSLFMLSAVVLSLTMSPAGAMNAGAGVLTGLLLFFSRIRGVPGLGIEPTLLLFTFLSTLSSGVFFGTELVTLDPLRLDLDSGAGIAICPTIAIRAWGRSVGPESYTAGQGLVTALLVAVCGAGSSLTIIPLLLGTYVRDGAHLTVSLVGDVKICGIVSRPLGPLFCDGLLVPPDIDGDEPGDDIHIVMDGTIDLNSPFRGLRGLVSLSGRLAGLYRAVSVDG
jgi:hypothetical protein